MIPTKIINPGPVIIMRKQDEYKSNYKYIAHNFTETLYESNNLLDVELFCKKHGIKFVYSWKWKEKNG